MEGNYFAYDSSSEVTYTTTLSIFIIKGMIIVYHPDFYGWDKSSIFFYLSGCLVNLIKSHRSKFYYKQKII